ncbi:MAG: sigma 54-interacting transcriptional regulator [Anaeromicrobium sp.]|jgi:arginine utilization regulatory protein|uniref:sigma-54 interaction domain-containing protein n=1 Tax=Anaeromicrobium sp. TaxID=1929132 RepID=UPI0025F88695|nr:sigma 54-interacting transcriptional regulator [Anaeromicrobium sp.]MCT4593731.1 sigma 54-interacting transcriptional regulator [Anaeromicrobium sp.]
MNNIFSKENIEIILDYVDEGIQIIDSKGYIKYYNKAASELDHINKYDMIGKHVLEVYPSLSPQTSTLLRSIERGVAIFDTQQSFKNYKGKEITTINSSFPIKSKQKVIGAIEISRDITAVKALSEKVIDLQEQLYDKKQKVKKNINEAKYNLYDIIGESEEMLKAKTLAVKASKSSSPILIYGETGTGKELFVQSIHNKSCRRNKPFIVQNCGALPSALLESILFGTVKGGFTGASDRPGLFELANGGTLFLDEINSMPLELQVKLLRVIQDGNIRRVGDVKTRHVDVRIIAASNEDPLTVVESKRMRQDLYYRLNVIGLKLPPLKERKGDMGLLVNFFIKKYNDKLKKTFTGVEPKIFDLFEKHNWPGNVRELENVIEGIMNLEDGPLIKIDSLPYIFEKYKDIKGEVDKIKVEPILVGNLKESLQNFEKTLIKQALKKYDNNISHAAKELKIPRQTLQYKIKKCLGDDY